MKESSKIPQRCRTPSREDREQDVFLNFYTQEDAERHREVSTEQDAQEKESAKVLRLV